MEFNIVLFGELKARKNKKNFTDKQKGQLESYLEDFIYSESQSIRKEITGFLASEYIIQFFKLSKNDDDSLLFMESTVFDLKDKGGYYLIGLLQTEPINLGFIHFEVKYNNKSLRFEKFIGSGLSSVNKNLFFFSRKINFLNRLFMFRN